MDAVLGSARAAGWPESDLHYEFFGADVAPQAGDGAFEVQLASSGRIVVVPKEQTVVQALAAAGIEVQTSCEQGVCGTCLTRVLDGVPDHRDMYILIAGLVIGLIISPWIMGRFLDEVTANRWYHGGGEAHDAYQKYLHEVEIPNKAKHSDQIDRLVAASGLAQPGRD